MHTETGGVHGDGRQDEPGSVALARFSYMLLIACDWTLIIQECDTVMGQVLNRNSMTTYVRNSPNKVSSRSRMSHVSGTLVDG